MDDNKLNELEQLLDGVVNSPTKKEAEPLLRSLQSEAFRLRGTIDPYLSRKLDEAISHAKDASGRVQHKQHSKYLAENSFYVFKSQINVKPQ